MNPAENIQRGGVQLINGFWHFPTGATIDFGVRVNFHCGMKHIFFIAALLSIFIGSPVLIQAQTNAAVSADTAEREQATLEKHIKPILDALKLTDADKAAKVRKILVTYFADLRTWHAANDAQIKEFWGQFDKARTPGATNIAANANAALTKIAAVYAMFKPQHEKFISDLSAALTPAQVEAVKDALTIGKVKFTYDVYLQIFPTLTDAQKAVVLQYLKDAREEAIDCEQMKEKSAFFKKYKIKIEDEYLTAQGYDPKQARKDFAAKTKAAKAVKPADDKQ